MIDRIDQHLGTLRNVANLRTYRQEVLASNIANADTPNYKARDIDFSAALKNALAGRGNGDLSVAKTSARHLDGAGGSGPAPVLYRRDTQPSADGNTVDMDIERSQFAENAIFYEAGVTFISGRLRTMMAAIQGNQ